MEKIKLSNGLRVVMEKIPNCRSVSFGIWVKTGSRYENLENNGVSHFIEHMLFKGTERFNAKEIAEQFDAIGGNVNAFTSKEYTCYYAKVLDEHLPIAVDVLADMFFRSNIDDQELSKEKNVILEEISMYEDTPDDIVHDLMATAVYGDHPLAYPILGTRELLEGMNSKHLRAYMDQHYTIENTVISVAGNIDEHLVELLERHFGDFQNHGSESEIVVPEFQSNVLFHKKKTEQNHICMSFPGCSIDDARQYAMVLLNNAIGGGMSSRLFQEIREKHGLAYAVYSYHSSHADNGLFTIYAGTAPKQTKQVMDLTKEVLFDLATKGISDDELRKGKEQLKGSLILSLEGTGSRMNRLGKNELMLGKHYSLDEMIANIEKVSMNDVESLLDHMFSVPTSIAMVGASDKTISAVRRDEFVTLRSNK
ncbi:M16 family metallopeptidase [Paenibacillus macquariensis]|uniref:Predicted Zn-dependent peptidase n=1 Tax=Paenibacillus macquariensis TaxID=948756 RepID=A0ABY1JZT9_9BACL|nr:pitrilysin family protein [Paenibacillus macquariensis]MEC0091354.1 pitrilysin family protein [Paenibacillus macquariensis]OAB38038.1 zinc protease [Paenibacillus macquariensis subsp. macquariensis]SIR04995.1 Predicted Zn-dependent peptidase [Paenibacillus macquariensis]